MGLYKPWKKRANLSVNCRPDWNASHRISLTIYYVFRWPYIMNVWYTLFITRFSYDILFFHIIYFVQQNIFCELSHNILCILIYIMCFTIYNVSYHIPYRWKISRTKVTKTSLSDEIFDRAFSYYRKWRFFIYHNKVYILKKKSTSGKYSVYFKYRLI